MSKLINAHEIKFRASSMGDIMSGVKKGWPVADSLTCKKKLIKIFREVKYKRYYNFSNKYTEKGIKMEQDSITLFSEFSEIMYTKNKVRKMNDFFTGECDLNPERKIYDIKSSWSLDNFPHIDVNKPDDDYEYQINVYFDLYDADEGGVVYCLVNAPYNLVVREKEKLWYNLGCPHEEDEQYVQEKISIEKNMIFDMQKFISDNPNADIECTDWDHDIPVNERVVIFPFKRNETLIKTMIGRTLESRSWMQTTLCK